MKLTGNMPRIILEKKTFRITKPHLSEVNFYAPAIIINDITKDILNFFPNIVKLHQFINIFISYIIVLLINIKTYNITTKIQHF